MKRIKVLVVDDSVVIRNLISGVLQKEPGIELVGTAQNGRVALAKIESLLPDLVTLDIEMPVLDGIATLTELRKIWPHLPVIMFSTLTERGAIATLDALGQGASDYVTKPSATDMVEGLAQVQSQLVPKILALGGRRFGNRLSLGQTAFVKLPPIAPLPARPKIASRISIVGIGCSTGGPQALEHVLPKLSKDFPVPIVIVQHMPPVFTGLLAQRLDTKCAIRVCEAQPGMILERGHAYMAPGNWHMEVRHEQGRMRLQTHQGPPENSCRPAVDVLFRSLAETCGGGVLAVMLTGMGQDGLLGSEALVRAGSRLLAQDEATSVVWGMPGAVVRAQLAELVMPLDDLGLEVERRLVHTNLPATP